tara:strand:+ start:9580 stop:9957 length:378 start_codon:yes stop_codon:yes gene_type:complete
MFSIPSEAQISQEKLIPYSSYIVNSNLVFLSGEIAGKPTTGAYKNFKSEVKKTIENVSSSLELAGSSLDKVISVTVYLKDIKQFDEFNEIYLDYFKAPYPTRTCVGVNGLVLNANIEITVIATKN